MVDEEESTNVLSHINKFLDTPILDANNKSNQGPVAEALKDFVKDDPQVASITFSVLVILAFLGQVRLFNSVVP